MKTFLEYSTLKDGAKDIIESYSYHLTDPENILSISKTGLRKGTYFDKVLSSRPRPSSVSGVSYLRVKTNSFKSRAGGSPDYDYEHVSTELIPPQRIEMFSGGRWKKFK